MSILNMAKNIKEVHPKAVICYKTGGFYTAYGKDCYILSKIFNYKIKKVQGDIPRCGFPKGSKNKVMAKIEEKKLDYIFIDVKNNYDVEDKLENGNLNNYDKILEEAFRTVKTMQKLEDVMESLGLQIDKPNFIDKLRRIEDIINEDWKI